jgi:4-hydroxy-2-oxoheptanedioate aldolase
VQSAIAQAFQAVRRAGKPVGIFATSVESARRYVAAGAGLVSVGSDIGLLSNGAKALRQAMVI